jgi:sporulation protein YlmC with PRC-barrel domain
MKIARPLVVSFSLLAFASASAYAAGETQKQSGASAGTSSPTGGSMGKKDFSKLDTDGDGSLSAAEAAADADSKADFKKMDQNGDQKISRSEYQAQGSASAGAGSASQGASSQQQSQKQQQQQGEMGTSQLIGKKVVDKQGKDLGKIEDVVINLESGKVHAAVLSFGGILGMGGKNFAFPMSELKQGKNNTLTVSVDKQKLENAEGFAQGQWPEMDSEYWGRVGGQSSAGASQSQGQKQKMNLVRASEIDGKEVQDKSGEEVGKIKDVIVDLETGELRNIVVSVKDAGETKVQPKSLIMGTGDKLVLDMDAQQLRSQAKQSKGGSSSGGSSTSGGQSGSSSGGSGGGSGSGGGGSGGSGSSGGASSGSTGGGSSSGGSSGSGYGTSK